MATKETSDPKDKSSFIESVPSAAVPALLDAGGTVYLLEEDSEEQAKKGRITAHEGNRLIVRMQMTDEAYAQSPRQNTPFHAALTSNTCTYHFVTKFTSSTPLPDHIWYITAPMKMIRQQSRSFVRIPTLLTIRARLPNSLGGLKNTKEMELVDLSGDGLCFISKEPVPEGTEVLVEIPDLPGFGTLATTCLVRRCAEHKRPTNVVYHIGTQMAKGLTNTERIKLERCLAHLQRAYLRRGLGVK